MEVGFFGLGRMGGSMALRLLRSGVRVVAYNRSAEPVAKLQKEGAIGAADLPDMVQLLARPRLIWLMLPAGEVTQAAIDSLATLLEPGDLIVDGGNTYWKDDQRRSAELARCGIGYCDVGTSGGIWGLSRGYCMMVGGERGDVERLLPLLAPLAGTDDHTPGELDTGERGFLHVGPAGAGHFAKMIHNGIEYGLMQAFAEGFDLLRHATRSSPDFTFNLAATAELWRHGSVISSWLLDLIAGSLADDPTLERFAGVVPDSGEGRWTVATALEQSVPADVLSAALYARFRSRDADDFAPKLLSALRAAFGGHAEPGGASHGNVLRT